MSTRAAIASALDQAVDAARREDPKQLDLVGVPARFDADGSETGAGVRLIAAAGRRGRPPGATNLATRDVKEYCRRLFNYDPVIEGFRWLQHTPETLAAVLGCTRLEAFDRLEQIRRSLQPLFYAPQAPVDGDGKAVPLFNLQIGTSTSSGSGARPPWEYLEQIQEVSGDAAPQSHAPQSHGDDK